MIGELIRLLPTFSIIDEPYHLLVEEGHAFADMPCLEDFVLQLERSIESIVNSEEDCLLDRCSADILAYLIAHGVPAIEVAGSPGVRARKVYLGDDPEPR